ncbi:MAG: GspH/FimT family pseudopilin [Candidatus Methylumidiphilus sp.]
MNQPFYHINSSGFTLLEMMLVLVVAALLAAVAVPNMQPAMASMQLRSATQDVASALRHTRGQALSRGREAEFALNVKKHFYRVAGRHKPYVLPESVKLELFTADMLMDADEGQGRIVFYPDGSASGGRVTLSGAGRVWVVDVNWLTGGVAVREDDDGKP